MSVLRSPGQTNIIAQDTGHTCVYLYLSSPLEAGKSSLQMERSGIKQELGSGEHSQNGIRTTEVWFVSGKAANKAARDRLQTLQREDATLSENKENIPPDVQKEASQRVQPKET